MRRAQTSTASVRFGDNPRQRSAPAFSIGSGGRDVSSRLLHSPAETIYKEARLGRSGPGPTTACPRAGDEHTRPRSFAARVIPPVARYGESASHRARADRLAGAATGADVGVKATEGGIVDGALGVQVKSGRPTCPSISLAGPRRTGSLFHERLRYLGKVSGIGGCCKMLLYVTGILHLVSLSRVGVLIACIARRGQQVDTSCGALPVRNGSNNNVSILHRLSMDLHVEPRYR